MIWISMRQRWSLNSAVNKVSLFSDIQIKELDKRASGQAFEVILGSPAPDAKGEFPLASPKKKDLSLEEIQRKLEAAEERRKVHIYTLSDILPCIQSMQYYIYMARMLHNNKYVCMRFCPDAESALIVKGHIQVHGRV